MIDFQGYDRSEYLKLPEKPGVYKFFDSDNEIIYVGKAINLKRRVSSYFTKNKQHDNKTKRLVKQIKSINFTVVSSEYDALLLENNLIKENKPKFNILLKDDKSYPIICVAKERFPRVYSSRNMDREKGEYFGPYSNLKTMYSVLDLFKKIYKLRTCKYNLSEANIKAKKFKVCLEYHIGNCKGPCENFQTEEEYQRDISEIKTILKGKTASIKEYYREKMIVAAENLKFEDAQDYKERLEHINNFYSKSIIVNPKLTDIDVFTIISSENNYYINYLKIDSGAIIATETLEIKEKIKETEKEVLEIVIFELRQKYQSKSFEIITNIEISKWENITNTIPKIGDKKKLLELSLKNALAYKKEKISTRNKEKPNLVLKQLKLDLSLQNTPYHIECFDNSNFQGTNPVASMVCFINGKPSKSNYRRYNIKTVEGPDDFASMEEIVYRRYKRLIDEDKKLPKLIVIDGGKGQLNAACKALKELKVYGKIPIIGIAKRLEEIYFPEDNLPIHISKKSSSLKLIQQIRDEAHRFAITFHRQKRSKNANHSSLEQIEGVGKLTIEKVFKHFKSIKRLKEAEYEEVAKVLGKQKATLIINSIKKED